MSKKDAGTHLALQSRACRGHGDRSGGGARRSSRGRRTDRAKDQAARDILKTIQEKSCFLNDDRKRSPRRNAARCANFGLMKPVFEGGLMKEGEKLESGVRTSRLREITINLKLTPHSESLLREYLARGGYHTSEEVIEQPLNFRRKLKPGRNLARVSLSSKDLGKRSGWALTRRRM